ISIIERELVERKKWIEQNDFLNIIAIAESTPGPIAINSATFLGYKRQGFLGSLFATLGVVLPSFIVIFTISLFFDKFLSLKFVAYAFMGIRVAVGFIILSAGVKIFKKIEKNVFNILLFSITVILMILFDLFAVSFSSVFYILIGGFIGLVVYLFSIIKKKNKKIKGDEE
ncbi:MAG: chromate transporter, partial [Clostridia bacterium]|nr:chromate transporter [Clostridia bacterium]